MRIEGCDSGMGPKVTDLRDARGTPTVRLGDRMWKW